MSDDLVKAMESFGIVVDRGPRFDGTPVRYKLAGKNSRSAFMIGHEKNGKHYAMFGTWVDRDQDQKWSDNGVGTPFCDTQWRELSIAADLLLQAEQKKTAKKAQKDWETFQPCTEHPYLTNKSVKAYGLKTSGETLYVPMVDEQRKLVNLQRIYWDEKTEKWEKRFLYKGRKKGCCYPISGDDKKIFICEGYATGATIHELTGCRVLIAFDTGNLKPVGISARSMFPDKQIVFAADNDHASENNPGIKYATEAAEEINTQIVIPECPPGTDFNDMAADDPAGARSILLSEKPRTKSISIKKIMSTDYPQIKWAVEGIIPEGLTILAGKPKFGKSWLMLGLSYAIANGLPAWEYANTKKASVYYLALEDSERRIKDRVEAMEGYFDTYPSNLHIYTEFPKLGQGFLEEVELLVKGDINIGCIIVDTLQKVRPSSNGGKRNLYQAEYEDFGLLQRFSITHGVPVIAIHHTRKSNTKAPPSNPMDEMSGSSGLQGVADTLIVCTRDGNNGTMFVTGREVNEDEYPMEFNRVNMTWSLADPVEKQIDIGPMMLSDFFKNNEAITAKEAAKIFDMNLRNAQRKLKDLVEEGKLTKNKPTNPKDPITYSPSTIF